MRYGNLWNSKEKQFYDLLNRLHISGWLDSKVGFIPRIFNDSFTFLEHKIFWIKLLCMMFTGQNFRSSMRTKI